MVLLSKPSCAAMIFALPSRRTSGTPCLRNNAVAASSPQHQGQQSAPNAQPRPPGHPSFEQARRDRRHSLNGLFCFGPARASHQARAPGGISIFVMFFSPVSLVDRVRTTGSPPQRHPWSGNNQNPTPPPPQSSEGSRTLCPFPSPTRAGNSKHPPKTYNPATSPLRIFSRIDPVSHGQ